MRLVELTTIPSDAVPVNGFKDHLRLGSGFSDDGLQDETLVGFLRAAMAAIEARTGKVLIQRDFSWSIAAWRDRERQPVPLAPVSALLSLTQVDRMGEETTVPLDGIALEPDMQRPVLIAHTGVLPAIPVGGTVRADLRAGFGPAWTDLPADLAQAVMMLAAHFYEYRHESATASLPYGVSALIERYRTVRIMMGSGS